MIDQTGTFKDWLKENFEGLSDTFPEGYYLKALPWLEKAYKKGCVDTLEDLPTVYED